jgi:hypothetical protein
MSKMRGNELKIQLYLVDPIIAIFECYIPKIKRFVYMQEVLMVGLAFGASIHWAIFNILFISHTYIPMMPHLEYWYYKFTSKTFTCNDYILSRIYFKVENSEVDKSLSYYISNRASAILCNKDREIGRLFAEYKDKLIIIDGENKKEREYLIPKTKVDRYDDKRVYFKISEDSLKEFEI